MTPSRLVNLWQRALCLLLGTVLALAVLPGSVSAQDGPRRARRAAHHKRSKTERVERAEPDAPATPRKKRERRGKARAREEKQTAVARAPEPPAAKPEAGPTSSQAAQAAQAAASGVNAQIVKEGATSVKMMEFTGLGIDGRLKSPQLVYFVQRVRAEFERPVLPHRSFMPELADSTAREPVR